MLLMPRSSQKISTMLGRRPAGAAASARGLEKAVVRRTRTVDRSEIERVVTGCVRNAARFEVGMCALSRPRVFRACDETRSSAFRIDSLSGRKCAARIVAHALNGRGERAAVIRFTDGDAVVRRLRLLDPLAGQGAQFLRIEVNLRGPLRPHGDPVRVRAGRVEVVADYPQLVAVQREDAGWRDGDAVLLRPPVRLRHSDVEFDAAER